MEFQDICCETYRSNHQSVQGTDSIDSQRDLNVKKLNEESLSNLYNVNQRTLDNDGLASNSILLQRMPSNTSYQNYFIASHLEPSITSDMVEEYVVQEQRPSLEMNIFPTTSNDIENLSQFSLGQQYEFHSNISQSFRSTLELSSQFGTDLTIASSVEPAPYHGEHNAKEEEERQRLLLQSSMSPLLAAVNDITKRDAELQLYLSQALDKEPVDISNKGLLSQPIETRWETSDIDYQTVTDKPVDCRARASLPTQFLKFGNLKNLTENNVYAKRSIRHCTRFGPLKGVIRFTNSSDFDLVQMQEPRKYPLLMLDEGHILDVSQEDKSNWMRYIRLAETVEQQNLLVVLENGNIYFKTTRNIRPKEELRVGYHQTYANRFMLPMLKSSEGYIQNMQPLTQTCHANCIECKEQRLLNTKNLPHKMLQQAIPTKLRKRSRVVVKENVTNFPLKRSRRFLRKIVNSCKMCDHRCVSKESLTHHIKLQHQQTSTNLKMNRKELLSRGRLAISRSYSHKCNLCSKRFKSSKQLKIHKATHGTNTVKPFTCSTCAQQCATPTALRAHEQSHTSSIYSCIYCPCQFKYVREFKVHVMTHQTAAGDFECDHCKKHYKGYHLVRKHVRLFHADRQLNCEKCEKKFQNVSDLHRHEQIHSREKRHRCAECKRVFLRKDQLNAHMRRLHRVQTANVQIEKKVSDTKEQSSPMRAKCSVLAISSSNRRKQTPTKLKSIELNTEAETYAAVSEIITSFLISEQELHEEFKKPETCNPKRISTEYSKSIRKCNDTQSKVKPCMDPIEIKIDDSLETINKPGDVHIGSNSVMPLYPFKCHLCKNANFKRRGILVNHLARVHPKVDLNTIDALNQPLTRPERVFPCPHCSNSYKSNAKRKVHILKHHPGKKLPVSLRHTKDTEAAEVTMVGTVNVTIYNCNLCPRQYAARNRLVSHYNRMHPEAMVHDDTIDDIGIQDDKDQQLSEVYSQLRVLEPEVNITSYSNAFMETENKLLKLSSAALEFSRYHFLNDRSNDDFNKLTNIFEESPLAGLDPVLGAKSDPHCSGAQFIERIDKL